MNKLITFLLIFIFIISTAITKNSTKKIEEKIYKKKENLAILESEYELSILEFDYLNSPEQIQKKMEKYFKKNEFSSIDILKLKMLEIKNKKIKFNNFFSAN
tara:strand:+ start:303 stop:608 length:306 start_codon:yes stop_codon:yes gene_type:complete